MVKIRYSELPAGLHVAIEVDGHSTVVYLQPGLTPAQRRAALVTVRRSGRMGQGPAVSAVDMRVAIAADRMRITARNGVAAMRWHPILMLPPLLALVCGTLAILPISVVTLSVVPPSKTPASIPTLGINGSVATSGHQGPAGQDDRHRGGQGAAAARRGRGTSPSSRSAIGPDPSRPTPTAIASPSGGSPSPSPAPSHGGTCIRLGSLRLCVHL